MRDESFQRYLLSKQTVDDRAINKDVLAHFRSHLPEEPVSIVEVGAGIGTMLVRMLRWNMVSNVTYRMVDNSSENIAFGKKYLPNWALENGFAVDQTGPEKYLFSDGVRRVEVSFVQADMFDYISGEPAPGDVLIAHAFLDLLPLPESLPRLFSLTRRLAWLTLVFDGVSAFEPVIDLASDRKIERLYHQSMDERISGGDSRSGRHMFDYLHQSGASIIAAGPSDWVVYPQKGKYKQDEAFFLMFILKFFQESLENHPDLDGGEFSRWLQIRRQQIARGKLSYIAHQLDFLVEV